MGSVDQRFSRRRFIGVTLGTTGAVLVAACAAPTPSPSTGPAQPTQAPAAAAAQPTAAPAQATTAVPTVAAAKPASNQVVTLRFDDWVGVGPEGIKVFTDEIIGKFQSANPNIKINYESADAQGWSDKMTAAFAAGVAPDVTTCDGAYMRQWMEAGLLLPLDDYVVKMEPDFLSDFRGEQVRALQLNGKQLVLPKYVSTIARAYNKDIFDKAGVPYPTDNWTWDDLNQAAQKLTIKDSSGKVTHWGYHVTGEYQASWVWANGAEWMDKEVYGTKMLIDDPKAIAGMQVPNDMQWKTTVSPALKEIQGLSFMDSFPTGKIAIAEAHSWKVTAWLKAADFEWDFFLIPNGPGGRGGMIFADGYAINKATKHIDESVLLLKHMLSPWTEEVLCTSVLGLQPSRKSVAKIWDTASAGAKAGKNVKVFSQMADVARVAPYFKDNAKVEEIQQPIWDRIWVTGDTSLAQGAKEVADRVNAYLAKYQ